MTLPALALNVYRSCIFLCILAVFCLINDGLSQSIPRPDADRKDISRPTFQTRFRKQSTTWNWFGQLMYRPQLNAPWQIFVSENFESNLLIPSRGSQQWKDEHNLNSRFLYRWNALYTGFYARSWFQSDKQLSRNNQFGNHALGLTAQYQPFHKLKLSPHAGYQQSRNRTLIEWGWDVGMEGSLQNYRIGQYGTNLEFSSDYDFYDQRQNYDNQLQLKIGTEFTSYAHDSLTFGYDETSKQYYSADGAELLEVKMYDRHINNLLRYRFSARNMISFGTKIRSRYISYFKGRNVLLFENQIRFMHLGRRFNYVLNLRSNEESQDNEEDFTDSQSKRTALGLQADYRLDQHKSLNLSLDFVKLQYDTPDENNLDDRDEQRFIINLGYRHRFSPYLTLNWLTYVYLLHQVYIYEQRSINNHWNRVFKLNPNLVYQYKRLRNTLSTEVLANYTVYDFEEQTADTRSFVFRKYSFADSLRYRIIGQIHIGIFTRYELEDKGSFFKSDFAQQVVQSYRSRFINLFLENRYFFRFYVRVGYTRYKRKEWRHIPQRRHYRTITNEGPYVRLQYHSSNRIMFTAHASLSDLEDTRGPKTHYATGYLRMNYFF